MKCVSSRRLMGDIVLLSAGLFLLTNPSFAQGSYDTSNTGAYGEFDLGSTMASASQPATTSSGGNMNIGSSGSQGSAGNWTNRTNEAPGQRVALNSQKTTTQHVSTLPQAGWLPLDRVFGGYKPLPPTVLDSFVNAAGGFADQIYGDEGTTGLPPFYGFDETHRIERGIVTPGLTTGHRSLLPEAWGYPN